MSKNRHLSAYVGSVTGAPQAEEFVRFGLREGPPNRHPGQGTANRRFAFANAMIELLWVNDAEEAQSECSRRTQLWEKWPGREGKASPFDICVRPVDSQNTGMGIPRGLKPGWVAIIAACLAACPISCNAVSLAESPDIVIAQVDAVIRARFEHIAKYVVREHYAVYRNGAAETAAEQTVQVTYQKSTGITYTTVSKAGSSMWLSRAIEPALESEKEVNDVTTRHQVMLTADNYEFEVEPARDSVNGRDCFVLDLKPRRKSPYLLNGKAWVDAKTYRLVRIRGTQSKSSSILAGLPLITRDFADVSGFAMVVHEEIEAHTFLLGQTVIKTDYDGYDILRDARP